MTLRAALFSGASVLIIGSSCICGNDTKPFRPIPGSPETLTADVYTSRPDIPIPDNDTVGVFDTLAIGSLTIGLAEVRIDTLYHTWPGDIAMTLKSPRGEIVELMRRPGSGAFGVSGDDFLDVVLSDTASRQFESITSLEAPYTGYWRPNEPLAAFTGAMPAGDWILHVTDNGEGDTGRVVRWSLLISAGEVHDIGAISITDGPPVPEPMSLSAITGPRTKAEALKNAELPRIHTGDYNSPGNTAVGHVAFWVAVQNFSTIDEPSYSIDWVLDGMAQTPVQNSAPLVKGTTDSVLMTLETPPVGLHVIRAWTVLATDQNASNDTAQSFLFEVLPPGLQVRETFEDSLFPPAGWAVLNRDGNVGPIRTWTWSEDPENPGPYRDKGYATTGYASDNGVYTDDWMIGPILQAPPPDSTQVDSLIFWTKSVYVDPGMPDSLQILVSNGSVVPDSFVTIGYFEVPTDAYARYAFRMPAGGTYRFAFRYIIYNGGPSHTSGTQVGIDEVRIVRTTANPTGAVSSTRNSPGDFILKQNYPNPFNPLTTIGYEIAGSPAQGSRSWVRLGIYDVLGREVTLLVDQAQSPGSYTARWDATGMASGVYFYRLEVVSAGGAVKFQGIRKLLLIR